MRIQSVVLENHRNITILRSYVINESVADESSPSEISSRPAIIPNVVDFHVT